jgi:hypothetical protein
MKNSIKTFVSVIALVSVLAFSAHAEDKETKKASGFGTGMFINKSGKVNVMVDKVNADAYTTLLVTNEKGDIVYQETVSKKIQKFGRILDVDQLHSGTYQVDVVSKGEKQSRKFEISEKTAAKTIAIN